MAELTHPTSGCSRSSRARQLPKVDLTAMVDLAFLLITFFKLTTTLAKSNAMDLAMPVDDEPMPVSEVRTMTICLGENNQLSWYTGTPDHPINSGDDLNFKGAGIGKLLKLQSQHVKKQTGKNLLVLIKPSDKSSYKNLVDILDELKMAGIGSYAIVDITQREVEMMRGRGVY